MAQLAATEQALFYPTDVPVVQTFVEKHINFKHYKVHAFDPCVGDGVALAAFANVVKRQHRKIMTWGIELEKNRAELAKKVIDHVLHSPFENVKFNSVPDFIFMNPPYDMVNGERAEILWINMVAPLLTTGHSMLLVLPEMFFEGGKHHNKLRTTLYKNNLRLHGKYNNSYDEERVGAFKFPDPYYEKFKQYIVLVTKTYSPIMEKKIHVEGVVGEVKIKMDVSTTEASSPNNFSMIPLETVENTKSLIFEKKEALFGKPTSSIPVNPLQPMRDEIMAAMIAGGMFSGIKIDNLVVRGGTTVKTIKEINETDSSRETIETQSMTAHVSVLDINTGLITSYDSSTDEFGIYIEKIAKQVAELYKKENPSICLPEDIARLRIKFQDVHAPRAINGHANGLFENQVISAATIMRRWELNKSVIVIGEMGTGKTITSIAATVGQVRYRKSDAQKIVVLLPSKDDIVNKWKEEIAKSCRDIPHKIYDIETITDTQKAFKQDGLTFILVKESMLKRSSPLARIEKVEKCFNCGSKNELVNVNGEIPENDNEYVYCNSCGVSYQTYVRSLQNTGDRKVKAYASIANYILKHYSKSYALIVDEAHQFKGGDSARGYASGSIIRGAWRALIMTGTFYNGYASSMYYLLYRAFGSFRENNSYEGVKDFVRLYGLEEKITKEIKKDPKYSFSGYNVNKAVRVKEIPGIHPSMIAIMLPFTVFMKLSDMNFFLPPKKEYTLFLDLPEEVSKKVNIYLGKIYDDAIEDMKNGNMSLKGQLTWAKAATHDIYPIGDEVGKHKLEPLQPEKLAPKEEALLRILSEKKAKGYPTLIYYIQTERRPIQNRLINLASQYGIKIDYMPSTEKNRVRFIEKALAGGADAVFCNANLVKEGIDLLQFKAIVWYGVTRDAFLVNQANFRIYRIGQTHEVEIYYLGYNKTYQAESWMDTAQKVAAMSAMHGDVRTGLAALLGEKSMISEVQNVMIEYEKFESDLTMSDLSDIINFTKMKPKAVSHQEDNWYDKMEQWKSKNNVVAAPASKKAKTPTAQPTLF